MISNILDKIREIRFCLLANKTENIGLIDGDLGSLLFFYQHYLYSKDEEDIFFIQDNLDRIFSHSHKSYNLCSGASGFGWLMNYFFKQNFLEFNPNEIFEAIDPIIGKWMVNEINNGNYDFLHGASGTALYFITKLPDTKSKFYLQEFAKGLKNISIKESDDSLKWKYPLYNNFDQGEFNISMSHGVSGIVNILCKLHKSNIYEDLCLEMIRGGLNFIKKQKLPIGKYNSIFPSWKLQKMEIQEDSRLAWCYGDLGIAVTFWNAAQVLEDKELENESIEILKHSCKRLDLKSNHVIDAGICHGSAGISHIFKRMYVYTKIPEFNETANYWIEKTLEFAKYNDGFAGYKAWYPEARGGLKPVLSLLEGIAGIGLALLSNISEKEPVWDECLLLS